MSEIQKEFERLPRIAEMLKNNEELRWDNDLKKYVNHRVFQDAETGYINGAFYAFQALKNITV